MIDLVLVGLNVLVLTALAWVWFFFLWGVL